MTRRWSVGQTFEIAGLWFRVEQGTKHPDDQVLKWLVKGQWRPIPMRAAAVIADHWYENEGVLYPASEGYRAGEKFMDYLRQAVRDGWATAESVLQGEKTASRIGRLSPEQEAELDALVF